MNTTFRIGIVCALLLSIYQSSASGSPLPPPPEIVISSEGSQFFTIDTPFRMGLIDWIFPSTPQFAIVNLKPGTGCSVYPAECTTSECREANTYIATDGISPLGYIISQIRVWPKQNGDNLRMEEFVPSESTCDRLVFKGRASTMVSGSCDGGVTSCPRTIQISFRNKISGKSMRLSPRNNMSAPTYTIKPKGAFLASDIISVELNKEWLTPPISITPAAPQRFLSNNSASLSMGWLTQQQSLSCSKAAAGGTSTCGNITLTSYGGPMKGTVQLASVTPGCAVFYSNNGVKEKIESRVKDISLIVGRVPYSREYTFTDLSMESRQVGRCGASIVVAARFQ